MAQLHKPVTLFLLIFLSSYIISGCRHDKAAALPPRAAFSVTDASPDGPTVDVLIDGQVASVNRLFLGNTTIIRVGSSLIYLPVLTGTHNLKISPDTGKTSLAEVTVPFDTNNIFSFFILDTLLRSKLKLLQLTDDLTPPAGTSAHVRALHLAPALAPVDVTITRGTDSLTLSNLSYVGAQASPNTAALSKFTAIPFGTYTIRVKAAGTQRLLAITDAITLSARKIYTFYVKGGARGQALGVSTITNY